MEAANITKKKQPLCRALVTSILLIGSNLTAADTLKSVVAEALDSNPEIRFQAQTFELLRQERRQEWGGYLPSLDLDVSVGQATRQYDDRGSFDRHYAEVSVTQMLFDGFHVRGRVAEADGRMLEQYYKLVAEAEGKALEITQAYLEVMRYRHLLELAQRNVDNHVQVSGQVRERAEGGAGSGADFNQAEGRLALARSNLRTEFSNLQSVTARFQRLVGRPPQAELAPTSELNSNLPVDLEGVLGRTFASNPSINATFANINAAESSLTVAKSNHYPRLELGLRHGTYQNNNSFDSRSIPSNFGDETVVELRMRYNLYRGGQDRAAQRAAYQRIGQAESLRDKACVDLRQTATIAWAELDNLNEKLNLLEIHRDASNQVVRAYRDQYQLGRRSLLDVLDSENEAFQAERSYVSGEYDLLLTRAQILASMGELLQSIELAQPDPGLEGQALQGDRELPAQYCALVSEALLRLN